MIRATEPRDLAAIAAIYDHYVRRTAATFDLQSPSVADWQRRRRSALRLGQPWMVTEEDGLVAGFASLSCFRPKAAYRTTVETTIYLAEGCVGRGLGRPLYEATLREAASRGFHLAVAGITLPNRRSVLLHEALGFVSVGVFEEVGYKHDAWRDVGWWQLHLQRLR